MAFDTAALDVATIGQGITLLSGDCRAVLPTLAANSVQCVVTSPPYYALRSYLDASHPDKHRELGSEATPDEFIAQMVAVFREVRRVLRDDGTLFLNLGDSYASSPTGSLGTKTAFWKNGGQANQAAALGRPDKSMHAKPKDLMMMPARVALALQADGWWLRSAIVWSKPNPMPESVSDRPTSAYEMVYLLTKRSRYYYDSDAVREDRLQDENANTFRGGSYVEGVPGGRKIVGNIKVPGGWDRGSGAHGTIHRDGRTSAEYQAAEIKAGRSCRNVWTIATSPFSAAHFATFPPELAERCIKAGTSERGCCAACGAPWVRVVERSVTLLQATNNERSCDQNNRGAMPRANTISTTTGWRASCKCDAPTQPCTILDPFAGAGTALLVADRLQRNAIGIELNTAYTTMAMERCRADAPLFSSWPPAKDPADQRMAADAKQRDLFAC